MNTIDDLLDAIATSKASAQAFIADPPTFVGRLGWLTGKLT